MCLSEKKERKKKNAETETGVVRSLGRARAWIACGPGSHDGLGRIAAWVCTVWSCLCYISISSSSLSFFSFFPHFFFAISAFWVINNNYFWVRNWVLETRFPCRCHMEKVPHQTWTTHKNRVPKTRFIDPKSSLLDSKC